MDAVVERGATAMTTTNEKLRVTEENLKAERAVTVRELLELLQDLPPDARVMCSTSADCASTDVYGLKCVGAGVVMLQGW